MAAAIIYLDANDVDQGSTTVLPGSHLMGEWETDHMAIPWPTRGWKATSPLPMLAKPGDVLFIHVMVLHTAGNNFSHTSRHKIINEYKSKAAIDQCMATAAHLAGLPVARNGRPCVPQL